MKIPRDVKRTEGEGHDRLTRLADAMLEGLDDNSDYDDIKAIVLLDDGDRGGAGLRGYENSPQQAVITLIAHAQAIAQAHGIPLAVFPGPVGGQG